MSYDRDYIAEANYLSIHDLALRYTELKKSGREYNGPCPVCRGGTDRFHVIEKDNKAGCRNCATRWDTVALYAAITNQRMMDAAKELLGVQVDISRPKPKPLTPAVQVPKVVIDPVQWNKESLAMIQNAKSNVGSPAAQEYLAARGLSARTIDRFHLGYVDGAYDPSIKDKREAILIPWADKSRIFAIKYRYIDSKGVVRFGSRSGSDPLVFGNHIEHSYDTLVIFEGEFNAMSLYESGYRAHAVSIGSDSNHTGMEYVQSMAGKFRWVIGWFDTLKAFEVCQGIVSQHMTGIISGRLGLDANECLVKYGADSVGAYVERARMTTPGVCPSCEGKKFYYQSGHEQICPCQFRDTRKSA